eukprot:359853-Chlamydomonas_euryale.AAC.2
MMCIVANCICGLCAQQFVEHEHVFRVRKADETPAIFQAVVLVRLGALRLSSRAVLVACSAGGPSSST